MGQDQSDCTMVINFVIMIKMVLSFRFKIDIFMTEGYQQIQAALQVESLHS